MGIESYCRTKHEEPEKKAKQPRERKEIVGQESEDKLNKLLEI